MKTEDIEESLTMEEILKTIRMVVSDNMAEEKKEEEVLELTNIVEIGDKNKIADSKPVKAENSTKDVLDKIDQVIGATAEPKSVKPVATEQKSNLSPEKPLPTSEKIMKDDEKIHEEILAKPNPATSQESKVSAEINKSEGLISQKALDASAAAIKSLIMEDKKESKNDDNINNGLESLVEKLLRPELSKWLNENLPKMIETIVEKEIKDLISQTKKN